MSPNFRGETRSLRGKNGSDEGTALKGLWERISRRKWVAALACLGLAGSGQNAIWGRTKKELGIVDAHVHVWSSDTEKYPLAAGFRKENLWFPSFSIEELLALFRPAGIHRVNLIQMTWCGLDHSYILDAIASSPRQFVGTGIVPAITDVSIASPDRTMVALAGGGIYAFRIRGQSTRPPLDDGPQWMDHSGFEKMFSAGAEHNLALSFLMTPEDLPELERMCSRHPECPVIIDHFCLIGRKGGVIESEVQALCRMARYKRVMVKIGAFYALGAKSPPISTCFHLLSVSSKPLVPSVVCGKAMLLCRPGRPTASKLP